MYVLCLSATCTIFEGTSCRNTPFYVTDWRNVYCHVGSQARTWGSETWICSVLFRMAWMKRNHQRQGKAVLSWFMKVKPIAPEGWIRDPQWKPSLRVWKEWGSQEAEPQWHTHWGGPYGEVANIKHGAKLSELLFLTGARHFHYLWFVVFGCQTEPGPFSLKHSHQSYCLLSFGSLQVCSLEQRMRYSCAVCEERGPCLRPWCREVSERSFNLCCRSIQPV